MLYYVNVRDYGDGHSFADPIEITDEAAWQAFVTKNEHLFKITRSPLATPEKAVPQEKVWDWIMGDYKLENQPSPETKQTTTETFVVYNTKKDKFIYYKPADDERDEDTKEWVGLGEATFGPHLNMTQIKEDMVSRDDHIVLQATITVNIPV